MSWLRPPRAKSEIRVPWAVLFAGLAHAVVLVAVLRSGLSFPRLTAPVRRSDSGVRPERLTFAALDVAVAVAVADRDSGSTARPARATRPADSHAPLSPAPEALLPGVGNPGTDPGSEATPSRTSLDHPFLRLPDPRLMLGSSRGSDTLAGARAAFQDSMRPWIARERAARDWTLPLGAGRIGLATERLHLGPLAVPMSNFTSLHDLDPRVRAQHAMQRDVREQADRIWRDSVVAARRRP